jgi:hypothetical protein
MFLKVISRQTFQKIKFFVGVVKVNDDKSRIRIHESEAWIYGSESGTNGSSMVQLLFIRMYRGENVTWSGYVIFFVNEKIYRYTIYKNVNMFTRQ